MDDEKDGCCTSDNSERRLRLRKNDKESIDNKTFLSANSNNKSNKNNIVCTSPSDDSILDFKSPKKIHSTQSKVINRLPDKTKKKVLNSKKSKIIINNERQSKSKKLLQKKKILQCDVQQPLIESAFFKSEKKEVELPQSSTDTKTAYVCPLCFKNLKDENSQSIHMKSCATKNNVSRKKLMDAMELQERQAAERKSLGLLSAPVLQDKKSTPTRKMTHDDPDLQLALALSKSLYEKEEMEEWDEIQVAAISSEPSVSDNNTKYSQKASWESLGFNRETLLTNNRPTSKTKKRKHIGPTILQRRTAMERERILTERIAEILMGCKDFTQRSPQKTEESNDVREKIIIKNQSLQQLRKIENTLWDRTKLIPTEDIFYVKQLSQIIELEKKEQKLNEEQNLVEFTKVNERSIKNIRFLDNEQMQEVKDVITMTDNDEAISSNTVHTCCKEKKFLDSLAISWRNMLNDSSASDIIVFVKNNRHIWTHKLVFYTRCTNILLDVICNDTEFSTAKEKICWLDTDHDVALAFLEFVYCGIIDRYLKVLDSETSLSGVRALGRKYKIHDLFAYLRQKKFKSNVVEIEHDYKTCDQDIGNVYPNIETTLNIPKLGRSSNGSPNCKHDIEENVQCPQEMLLHENVNNDQEDLHPLENNYISVKNSCVLQDEKSVLMELSEEINSRSCTPVKRETSTSPDMFDDTPVRKHNDKSIVCSTDGEDSDIHILLNLIKQDADIDIGSQKLLKTQNAEYSELDKDIPICSKNVEQDVMEIDSDLKSNSLKSSIDSIHENSLIDTPQSSKSKYIQDSPSEVIKQKSNLTLFIEKIQKENAELDAALHGTTECFEQLSPIKQKNPFYVDKHDDLQSYGKNIEQSADTKKKPGRLTMIEERIQSFAAKNPDFYSHLSNEYSKNVGQTNSSHIDSLSPKMMESSHNNVLNCTQNFTSPDEKRVNISEQDTTKSAMCLQHSITMNQSLSETNEKEISMDSKYMRDHKDNSIAKYRKAINRNKSDSNLSDKNTSSDSIDADNNINEAEKDEILSRRVLTQKDVDIIVSSDTDVESVSSNVSHIASENDDFNYENIMSQSLQQSIKKIEDNKQNTENSSQVLEIEKFSQVIMTNAEEEKDINSPTKSNRDKLNTTEITFVTNKSGLNDDQKEGSVPSPIMVSSSPDFSSNESCSLNMESLLQEEHYTEDISETSACKLKKSVNFSLNYENDIYLANVDIDQYKNPHVLEKSQSFSILNIAELKNGNASKCNNKNIKDKDVVTSDYKDSDNNATSSSEANFTSIRKFKRKSLSEGHISINRSCNQGNTSTAMQFQCNYIQNIGNAKMPKIIEKDVTPPPDYNDMSTSELHREMKKYGLKIQIRSKAVKLLTHIYNELHPLMTEKMMGQQITEISSDEDEGPPLKKRNVDNCNLEKSSNAEESGNELCCSQDSNDSISSTKKAIKKEMQFYETESDVLVLENSLDITEAFMKLINIDKDLHNKILQYEPINIEQLRSLLKTYGFKCKLSNLMSFLDQQCITFYAPEQSFKSRTRRKA